MSTQEEEEEIATIALAKSMGAVIEVQASHPRLWQWRTPNVKNGIGVSIRSMFVYRTAGQAARWYLICQGVIAP